MPSFTTQIPNLQEVGPVVEIKVAIGSFVENVFRQNNQNIPNPIPALAMIDTGATGTVIREDIVQQLKLNPVGITFINTPSSTNVQCYEYLIRLLFPNNVVTESVVIAAPLQGQHIQCLIGRDVLRHGVLVYIGYTNTFTLSF
ncbi:MAG: retroviral-like aspartic protease family protein [bacterium]|nr:retroviral-like aspartic protease family protein [bacterium]